MPGRLMPLARPQPDIQPKGPGAGPIGYADGYRPPPRYSKSSASETWEPASESVTNQLHCNLQTRVSVAPTLDDGAQRELGVNTYTPGRRPAPRVALSCLHGGDRLRPPSGGYARDLALRPTSAPPTNPDGGPLTGPSRNPPGLGPLPKPETEAPRTAPPIYVIEPPAPPTLTQEQRDLLTLQLSNPRVPGTLQTINFHFTGDTTGGPTDSELRIFGPIGSPFIIRQIWINADSAVQPGQFLDILVAQDGNPTDTTTPTGSSIFEMVNAAGTLPTEDQDRGIAIPPQLLDLKLNRRIDLTGQWLKLRTYFAAPAAGLPNVHVTMVIERLDLPDEIMPPIPTRAPLLGATGAPTPTTTTPGAVPTLGATPTGQAYASAPQYMPAWRVAALGLQPNLSGGVIGAYPAFDAFTAWQIDPRSAAAAPFRDRIKTVLDNAKVTNGTAYTMIDSANAIAPTSSAA